VLEQPAATDLLLKLPARLVRDALNSDSTDTDAFMMEGSADWLPSFFPIIVSGSNIALMPLQATEVRSPCCLIRFRLHEFAWARCVCVCVCVV
jgi:hypothetical protein